MNDGEKEIFMLIAVTNDEGKIVKIILNRKAYRKARWRKKMERIVKRNTKWFPGWGRCLVIK